MRSRMTWRTFFDAVIMAKAKRRLLLRLRCRLSCRGVNAMGRAVRGAAVARARAVRGTAVSPWVFESRDGSRRIIERVSPWSLYTRGMVLRWSFAPLLASLLGFCNPRGLAGEKETAHPVLSAATPFARRWPTG
jgi:hypothetical protein